MATGGLEMNGYPPSAVALSEEGSWPKPEDPFQSQGAKCTRTGPLVPGSLAFSVTNQYLAL
jgi:hypothetical protein